MQGFDPWHPEYVARLVSESLPNAEMADFTSRYTKEEMEKLEGASGHRCARAFLGGHRPPDFRHRSNH